MSENDGAVDHQIMVLAIGRQHPKDPTSQMLVSHHGRTACAPPSICHNVPVDYANAHRSAEPKDNFR